MDFIGIGAARSGSTWVSRCLREHPGVLFSSQKSVKELHFFNEPDWRRFVGHGISNYGRGARWYLAQFPPSEPGKIRGEFSTSYLSSPLACRRIKEHFPEVGLLVILRNPVEMIYSLHHYARNATGAAVPGTFEQALAENYYLDLGLYHKHLARYFAAFPRSKIHVMLLDEVENSPRLAARGLYSFLGVDEGFEPSCLTTRVNAAVRTRSPLLKSTTYAALAALRSLGLSSYYNKLLQSPKLLRFYARLNTAPARYGPLAEETRGMLKEYFREDTCLLEELIGRDLTSWKS